MTDILDSVRGTIDKYRLFKEGDCVLAAVSGGSDSVFLLRALHALKEDLAIELKAAHLDHMIRGEEAEREAEWVRDLCRSLSIECVSGRTDSKAFARENRLSLEEAARISRYDFLDSVRRAVGARAVALGHTMDDQAETLILRLCRGSGMTGLACMSPLRDHYARPLLDLRRDAIREYLDKKGFPYLEDPSNLDLKFRRNMTRHKVIPALESCLNPSVVEVLARTASVLAEEDSLLESIAHDDLSRVAREVGADIELDTDAMLKLTRSRRRRALRAAARKVRGDLRNISAVHIDGLMELLESGRTGGRISLPSLVAHRDYGRLVLSRGPATEAGRYERPLKVPGVTEVGEANLSLLSSIACPGEMELTQTDKGRAYFDLDRIALPLSVRNRRAGDRLTPYKSRDSKKLKELFIDDKISRRLRDSIPIVVDNKGILWVPGGRRSNRALVTKQTERILCIEARESSDRE
jgi:tRNA(Ile)-lysidine synthase